MSEAVSEKLTAVIEQVPLDQIDVSDASIYADETWGEHFARLRRDAPVHYQADSPVGPFWSVTTHDLIKQVDTNHAVYSSEVNGISIADPRRDEELLESDVPIENFISMDPPRHDQQRGTVSPSVAPSNLKNFEPLIRERAADILDNLPVGETFNWVQDVSVELTARMLATLFDFPYEDRHKLIHWSDITTNVPELTGIEIDMDERKRDLMECATTFMHLWHERAAIDPKFDLISMLAHGRDTKDMINDPMLYLGNVLLLIVGGNDTTRNSISGGVIALNQYPDEYQKLREQPQLIPNMVAEMVRWQTPVIHMRRTALEDTELGGKKIKA
ncbi:MAG: cytochrome P450, partial [Pseudomonadota bacterium]